VVDGESVSLEAFGERRREARVVLDDQQTHGAPRTADGCHATRSGPDRTAVDDVSGLVLAKIGDRILGVVQVCRRHTEMLECAVRLDHDPDAERARPWETSSFGVALSSRGFSG
jgi:hypothetical protein